MAIWLGAAAVAAAGWALLARLDPAAGGPVVCIFRRLTGLACPGCGLTRGVLALAAGDLAGAQAYHPLAPLVAIEALVAWVLWGGRTLGLVRRVQAPWVRLALAHVALFAAVWAARIATHTLPI